MARKRMIDPDFWLDEEIAALPMSHRLFYIGSWNFADDRGVLTDSPKRLQAQIFPYDGDVDVIGIIEDLCDLGKFVRFTNDNKPYLWIRNFLKHQTINRPSPSKLPAPPAENYTTHGALTESSLRAPAEEKLREVKYYAVSTEYGTCVHGDEDSYPQLINTKTPNGPIKKSDTKTANPKRAEKTQSVGEILENMSNL